MRIGFDEKFENIAGKSNNLSAKLKLSKDESARVALVEDIQAEYVHTLEAPKIENGRVKTEMRTTARGEQFEATEMEFFGSPICLGDPEVLQQSGLAPDDCPACKLISEEPEMGKPPQLRMAVNVIRYGLKDGFSLREPFSADIAVWTLSPGRYKILSDLNREHGNLMKLDLLLGPCKSEKFQNYEIKVGHGEAEWQASAERKKYVKQLVENNKIEDVRPYCGRVSEAPFMARDVAKVKARYEQIRHGGASEGASKAAEELTEQSLAASVAGFSEKEEAVAETVPPSEPKKGLSSFDDLLG